jgi:putative Holliday junction resolvase
MQIIASGLTTVASATAIVSSKRLFFERKSRYANWEPKQMNGLPLESASIIKGLLPILQIISSR